MLPGRTAPPGGMFPKHAMLFLTIKPGGSVYVRDLYGRLLVRFQVERIKSTALRIGVEADPRLYAVDRGQRFSKQAMEAE